MYWTDDRYNRIWMANLNGSDATTVITSDLSCPGWTSYIESYLLHSAVVIPCAILFKTIGGIAWDWVNEKLYWTDFCKKVIEVYDPNSGYRRVLLNTGSNSYNKDIAVDPTTG